MANYEYTIGKEVDLKKEQEVTLSTPPLKSNAFLKIMYLTFDIVYGRNLSLPKVKVLEILARYPYWAWENIGYHRVTKLFCRTDRVPEDSMNQLRHLIDLGRDAQDNEQDHLFIIEQIIHQKGLKLGWFRHYLVPRMMAFAYYYLTLLIFRIRPAWSFAMNAAFESHAEHEYMSLVAAHPEWDSEEVESVHFAGYPGQRTIGELIRRISLDERDHMNHSLEEVERLRSEKNCPIVC